MRRAAAMALFAAVLTPLFGADARGPLPAFPGAEGAGAFTPGGRGGRVFEVTTLDDAGPGSLRAAVEADGPRTVVFRVGGRIRLRSPLVITHPFIAIAGQTAPGDGVCVSDQPVSIETSDVVLRYLRIRNGNVSGKEDALNGHSARNVVIDHCSLSWAAGQNLSLYRPCKEADAGPCENITVQWTISGECLERRRHAFGGTVGGRSCSYHHNLFACNLAWEPGPFVAAKPGTENLDFRNNVVFVWRNRPLTGAARGGMVNVVANYFKPDEAVLAKGTDTFRFVKPEREPKKSDDPRWGRWHVADNAVHGSARTTADNWAGGVELTNGAKEADVRARTPFPAPPITQQAAPEAYELVLAHAGATLPRRDAVDARVVETVRLGAPSREDKPSFATAKDVVNWPEYRPGEPPADSDHDGMPDWWELKYGLNPHNPADANQDMDGDGYTNLEEYLNGTDPTQYVDYRKPGNNRNTLTIDGKTP
jgi:hypothetical protein